MVLCFFIASFMLISIVLPSIAGLWFEMDVLIQMHREFQSLKKKKKKRRRGVGFANNALLCSGKGSEQSLIRHAGEGLMLLFVLVALTFSCILLPFGFWSWHLSLIMQMIKVWAKLVSHFHFFSIASWCAALNRWLCPDVSSFFNSLNCAGLWTGNIFHHKHVLQIFKVLIALLSYRLAWVALGLANYWLCFEMLSQLYRNLHCFLSEVQSNPGIVKTFALYYTKGVLLRSLLHSPLQK